MGKITLEQKKKVVQIALGGGDPVAYLEECGSEKPDVSWANILRNLETKDPEVYELLTRKKKPKVDKGMPKKLELEAGGNYEISAKEAMDNIQDAADEFFGKCEEAGLNLEEKTITAPISYDGFKVRAVSGIYGRYSYSETRSAYIDYENNDGDELSMTLEQWRGFLDELRRAALVLGVEL